MKETDPTARHCRRQRMKFFLDHLMDSYLRALECSRRNRLSVSAFPEFRQIAPAMLLRLPSRLRNHFRSPVHWLTFHLAFGADRFPWRLADWRSGANDTNLRCQAIPAVLE